MSYDMRKKAPPRRKNHPSGSLALMKFSKGGIMSRFVVRKEISPSENQDKPTIKHFVFDSVSQSSVGPFACESDAETYRGALEIGEITMAVNESESLSDEEEPGPGM